MKKIAIILAMLIAFIVVGCEIKITDKATEQVAPQTVAAVVLDPNKVNARAYGLRGLFGGAAGFSLGVDDALTYLKKADQGVRPSAVKAHWQWRKLAQTAEANWRRDKKPIILVGHSMGGDSIVDIAEYLKAKGIPVALMVFLDPTPFVGYVPSNVSRAVNYRHEGPGLGKGWIKGSDTFKGTLLNRSKVIRHTDLDNDPAVHKALACESRAMLTYVVPNCPWAGELKLTR